MRSYFKISNVVDHEDDIRYIDICIKLLDILIDDGLGAFDYENMKMQKYVNVKNANRFKLNTTAICDINTEIYNFDIYMLKVKHLYYEILKNKITDWWD
jgi:hypothetical protein